MAARSPRPSPHQAGPKHAIVLLLELELSMSMDIRRFAPASPARPLIIMRFQLSTSFQPQRSASACLQLSRSRDPSPDILCFRNNVLLPMLRIPSTRIAQCWYYSTNAHRALSGALS